MHTRTAINEALDYAINCGVNHRVLDVDGVLRAIDEQAANTDPLTPGAGFAVEVGSANGRPWEIHVSRIEVAEAHEDGETYVNVTVPDQDVVVTLSESGKAGRTFTFPAGAQATP